MLRRVALVGLLLLMSGIAAIFAAGHFGIHLPWETAATKTQSPTPEKSATSNEAREASKSTSDKAKDVIEDTTAALTPPTETAKPEPGGVEIDISRVSPDGTSVFAGRAEPDTYVTVYEDGKAAGSVKADENGEWSLATEHKFANADPKLSFEASKTAPPAPEPPKPAVAAAAPPAKASASSTAVADEVMRKFEKLVEDAREEAKKQREASVQPDTAAQTETKTETKTAEPAPSLPVTPESTPAEPDKKETAAAQPAAPESAKAPEAGASPPAATAPFTETADAQGPAATTETGPTVIPVPLMFFYNEATLTPEGRHAADLLLEYLNLKRLNAVELTGHADERGTNEYNMDLSRDRLETVSALLRQGGYDGELKLTPKGKTEPYMGVDRSAYTGEALFQLDRRVELRVGR